MDSAVISEELLGEWVVRGIEALSKDGRRLGVIDDDLDEIDPEWSWDSGTMDEVASLFRLVAGLVPPGWDGVLEVEATMEDSADMKVGAPNVKELRPHLMYPPTLFLNSPWRFLVFPERPREVFRWVWETDPWEITDFRTRVVFASGRSPEEREFGGEFYNVVLFTRYGPW
jgi:hypothetical protein